MVQPPSQQQNKRKRDDKDDDELPSNNNNHSITEPKSKKVSSSSSVQETTLLEQENINNVSSIMSETNQQFVNKAYSSSSYTIQTSTIINLTNDVDYDDNKQDTTLLDPLQYDTWTKQEIFSLLVTKVENGGANLSIEDVQPLFNAGFTCSSLNNIVKDLVTKPNEDSINRVIDESCWKRFPHISLDIITSIVKWVDNLLKTKFYHLWSYEQLREQLVLPILKGGAGLSEEEMLQLPFNNSIKQIIQLNDTTTLEELMNETQTITKIKNFLSRNQITVSLIESFKNSHDITPNMLKKARIDPLYDYLRNLIDPSKMNQLETMIGSNIPLPKLGILGSNYLPKEFDPNSPFLLTRQRFNLLKKVVMRVDYGFVLSGPFGISKSYAMYLLAAYAIVNSIPLLYVPLCGEWVSKYQQGGTIEANDYIRSLIFYWNSDILSDYDIYSIKNDNDFINYFSKMIGNKQPVLFLFDDHNELFIPNNQDKLPALEDYFMPFTKWTRISLGANTIIIYCGSAYSAFEDKTFSKIVRIVPPSEEEFKQLVTNFGIDLTHFEKISFVTGRIPRELKELSKYLVQIEAKEITDSILNNFIQLLMNIYNQRFNKLLQYLEKNKKNKDFLNTLERLFYLGLHKERPIDIIGAAYDYGLMYKSASEYLYIINELAKRILFNYYCKEVNNSSGDDVKVIYSYERELFKRYLIVKEYNSKHEAIYYTTATQQQLITLQYHVNVHMSLDLKRGLCSLSHKNYLTNTTVLFIPELESFPAFDYAIISYQSKVINILLKQTSISPIDSRYNTTTNDIDNLTKRVYTVNGSGGATIRNTIINECSNEMLFSLLELIIHGVVGDFNVETKEKELIVKQRKYNVMEMAIKNGHFNSTIQIDDMIINWYYIYESGTCLNEQSVTKVNETGVLYRNKEEIQDKMKIIIEEDLKG